ncbi:uncharacterized protein LOC125941864 [Dermacentor silvarum]|uniref:uncharacterized protein LOC125941864 n=1 Tax=Dermacentor silvarum TaxID=543639 RepID=UPI002101CB6F|nr:uncharacterized protein LOC125941864 [Dermacentor silvarum]
MGDGERYVYRVSGFGSHVERKLVEFLRELDQAYFCSWCGTVTRNEWLWLVSCLDVVCYGCILAFSLEECPVHRKIKVTVMELKRSDYYDVAKEKVRCVNAMRGCKYEGELRNLDSHLGSSCDFHMVACVRCRRCVPYKDIRNHYPTCKGASEASGSSGAAMSLFEDMRNARKELEQALALTDSHEHCELRKAVISASEMLVRLEDQLGALGSTQ